MRQSPNTGIEAKPQMSSDPLRSYLNEIGQYPLLTREQSYAQFEILETGLAVLSEHYGIEKTEKNFSLGRVKEQLKDGTLELNPEHLMPVKEAINARDAVLNANLRLVVSIAKKYVGHGMELLDLIQEGNIGLDRAVHKFDYSKGFAFSTYATWWVRQGITRSINDKSSTIRVPVHMAEAVSRYTRLMSETESGEMPLTLQEIAKKLNVSVDRAKELRHIYASIMNPVSLQDMVGNGDSEQERGDRIPDKTAISVEDAAIADEEKRYVTSLIGRLPTRDQSIIIMRFGLNGGKAATLDEIGKEFNVTRERIRQLEKSALSKLRRLAHVAIEDEAELKRK